jgi:diaminopropionate ammonia-lyase
VNQISYVCVLGIKQLIEFINSITIPNLKSFPHHNHPSPQDPSETTICTMTDGNHGRAVAHIAKKLGCKCKIYVPQNMVEERKQAILGEGAEIIVVDGGYDDAIEEVKRIAEENGYHLISDTAWPGYEQVPEDIMAGYGTIFREVEEEM